MYWIKLYCDNANSEIELIICAPKIVIACSPKFEQ